MGKKEEMKRDFVSTVYIINDNKVLLVFHKKMNMWLPPGGHIENELPEETVIREAKEETGLDIELVNDKDPKLTDEVEPLFNPEFVQLEDINLKGEEHQHIDLIYLARPKTHEIKRNDETEEIRWFSIEDLDNVLPLVRYQAKKMLEKMNDIKIHKNK